MPTIYAECPQDVIDMADAIVRDHYPDLIEADVTVKYLFARSDGDNDSPALTHGGYPASAVVRINNLQKRVEGLTDASIAIDQEAWEDLSHEERTALLDHELHHLEVKRNKAKAVKYDDANRPCLKMRKHDWQHGGFYAIAKRYGEAALDVQAIRGVQRKFVQMELAFA